MLTKKDFIRCMKFIQKDQKDLDKFEKKIGEYFEDMFIFTLGLQLISSQINILKIAMKDTGDDSWIDWYIYENGNGGKAMEAGYDDKTKPIKNLEDLFELLEEQERRKK